MQILEKVRLIQSKRAKRPLNQTVETNNSEIDIKFKELIIKEDTTFSCTVVQWQCVRGQ